MMVRKWRYRDREGGIKSFDVQPSKLKALLAAKNMWKLQYAETGYQKHNLK